MTRLFSDFIALDHAVALAHVPEETAARLILRYRLPYRRSGNLLFITPASLASARDLERQRRREARS